MSERERERESERERERDYLPLSKLPGFVAMRSKATSGMRKAT